MQLAVHQGFDLFENLLIHSQYNKFFSAKHKPLVKTLFNPNCLGVRYAESAISTTVEVIEVLKPPPYIPVGEGVQVQAVSHHTLLPSLKGRMKLKSCSTTQSIRRQSIGRHSIRRMQDSRWFCWRSQAAKKKKEENSVQGEREPLQRRMTLSDFDVCFRFEADFLFGGQHAQTSWYSRMYPKTEIGTQASLVWNQTLIK